MEQKIKLSSNIPITLPEKLSENQFGLGFLYPCGKGLELKDGQTWFEKVCLSLNKINSIVGFQNSNLKIPEYIAETTQVIEKYLDKTSLLVRYNAQTKVNDIISSFSPEKNKDSFNDKISKSITKGSPMVILGERSLKAIFPFFEEVFGLSKKIKFIINHEIAHNIDSSRKYNRGEYSLKTIMEKHIGSNVENKTLSSFKSNSELSQTKKMITQLWTLSLEHYADVLGFLNMRNQLIEEKVSIVDINQMLNALVYERKDSFEKNSLKLKNKVNNPLESFIDFEDKYKCLNHYTVNALIDLKSELKNIGDRQLTIEEIENLTVKIVTKADLKSLYIISKTDNKTLNLLDKIFTSEPNEKLILKIVESKKPIFENKIKELIGDSCLKEIDKFIINNKDKQTFYKNINVLFCNTAEDLEIINKKEMHEKINKVRFEFIKNFECKDKKIKI